MDKKNRTKANKKNYFSIQNLLKSIKSGGMIYKVKYAVVAYDVNQNVFFVPFANVDDALKLYDDWKQDRINYPDRFSSMENSLVLIKYTELQKI